MRPKVRNFGLFLNAEQQYCLALMCIVKVVVGFDWQCMGASAFWVQGQAGSHLGGVSYFYQFFIDL